MRLLDRSFVEEHIITVQVNGNAQRTLGSGHARHVIDMSVSQQDMTDVQFLTLDERRATSPTSSPGSMSTASRVSSHATTNPFLKKGPTACVSMRKMSVLLMILAVLDDLMFTSKIRTTANQLGVPMVFARSPEGAHRTAGEPPSLVIFDLNNPRTIQWGSSKR